MVRSLLRPLALLPLALLCAAVQGQVPELALGALPSPSARAEVAPGLAADIGRWREQARAAEHGEGVPVDRKLAAELYCRAARYGDADSQYELAWMLVNARGIERDDAQAAHLFAAAAEQGIAQAAQMLRFLAPASGPVPLCLTPPEADVPQVAAASAASESEIPPFRVPAWAPPQFVRFVRLVAPDYQVSPELVLAVMANESNFDPLAISPKNAQGLMQLTPDTAARFRVRLADPMQNIRGGMAYLRWLLAYFEGDLPLVLAAYNAGERTVERYRGVPPYAETRLYVRRIIDALGGRRTHPFDRTATPPSEVLASLREPARTR